MDLTPSSLASESKPPPAPSEDSAVMTIEFLRARLLSERAVSKAARERADQLANKVQELAQQLEYEILLRKKLEALRFEVMLKYREELGPEYCFTDVSQDGSDWDMDQLMAPPKSNYRDGLCSTVEGDARSLSARMDRVHAMDDSPRFLDNEGHDGDDAEIIDLTAKEKGVLSWGRRKASRRPRDKDFGSGIEWMGRSMSQRSFASLDGESPQKRWIGKSVRKIRKNQSGREEQEKDTEVERVLEQQAEFIEKFEAEESAQRAWEAQYEEQIKAKGEEQRILASHEKQKIPVNHEIVEKTGAASESFEVKHIMKKSADGEDDIVKLEDEEDSTKEDMSTIKSHHAESSAAAQSDCSSSNNENYGEHGVCSTHTIDSSNGCHGEVSASDDKKLDFQSGISSIDNASSNRQQSAHSVESDENQVNKEENVEDDTQESSSTTEVEEPNRYRKHISSSFQFAVCNTESDQAIVGSPEMPGLISHKSKMQSRDHHDSTSAEESLKCQVVSNAAEQPASQCNVSKPRNAPAENSADTEPVSVSANSAASEQYINNSQIRSRDAQQPVPPYVSHERQSNPAAENHPVDIKPRLQLGSNGDYHRYSSEFPLAVAHTFSSTPELGAQERQHASSLLWNERSGMQESGSNVVTSMSADIQRVGSLRGRTTVLPSRHKSLDGLERVDDVLRALQLAKNQIQTSTPTMPAPLDWEAGVHVANYRGSSPYDGRIDAAFSYTVRPSSNILPHHHHSTAPNPPYPFRDSNPGVSYGVSSSRHPLVAEPYMQYGPRFRERHIHWHEQPLPQPGAVHSNLQPYGAPDSNFHYHHSGDNR